MVDGDDDVELPGVQPGDGVDRFALAHEQAHARALGPQGPQGGADDGEDGAGHRPDPDLPDEPGVEGEQVGAARSSCAATVSA